MNEIKIKVTQDLEAIKNYQLEPLIVEILGGKICTEPNESMLSASCQDIIWSLGHSTRKSFRYERTNEGHFFYLDSTFFDDDPNIINVLTTMHFTKIEIVSHQD